MTFEEEDHDLEAQIMAEREEDIEKIKELTVNLNALANTQHEKVANQGEVLDSAERNVVVTQKEIKKANVELTQARENSRKSRKTMATLICVAILIVIVVMFFLLIKLGVFSG